MDKPKSIKLTTIFIFLGWLVSLASILIISFNTKELMPNVIAKYTSFGVTTLLVIWLAYKINCGRNWARIIYSALILISLVNVAINFQQFFLMPIEFTVVSALTNLCQIIVILFLFTPSSNVWFKNNKGAQYT